MANLIDTLRGRSDTEIFAQLYDVATASGVPGRATLLGFGMINSDTALIPNDDAFVLFAQSIGFAGTDEAGAAAHIIATLDAGTIGAFLTNQRIDGAFNASSIPANPTGVPSASGYSWDGTSLTDADAESPDIAIVDADVAVDSGTLHITDNVIFYQEFGFNNTFTYPSAGPVGPTEMGDDLMGTETSDRVDLLGGNDTFSALGGSDSVEGGAGADDISGDNGNDTLFGDDGNDTLRGGNGRDVLDGGADNDLLEGGNDDDVLSGDAGQDTLIGGSGDDILNGGDNDDVMNGGAGDDTMTGGAGGDTYVVRGGEGRDVITDFIAGQDRIDLTLLNIWDISQLTIQAGGTGIRINTGNGNYIELTGVAVGTLTNADFILVDPPVIAVTEGGDDILATDIAEFFAASDGADNIRAMGGNDTVYGGNGRDTIDGGIGYDVIDGGSGADRLFGNDGYDTINGGSDNDYIRGGNGYDVINGGNANDRLYGDGGFDTIFGENGNDRIYGGNGNDDLSGGAGKDTIEGGGGRDTIEGGWGDDYMTGGGGNDVFVFADDRTRADTIADFTVNQDVIQIEAYGYTDISDLNMVQDGADVLITFSNRDSIRLLNVDINDLDNDDFTLSNELIVI